MFFQIAIDGPSGVGKSTLAKALSQSTGYTYVNTGLIFRGLAWYFLKYKELSIEEGLTNIAKHKNLIFHRNSWSFNGKTIPEDWLKTKEVPEYASKLAKDLNIRNYVLHIERQEANQTNIIMEGRDIGTVVFPGAILKIFLTASHEVRTKRRYLELKSKNLLGERTIENIANEIKERDKRDFEREFCPLKKAEDAIEISTDNKSTEELVEEIKKLLTTKIAESKQ